jgi:hypothetical protein
MRATIRRTIVVAIVAISAQILGGVGHASGTPAQVCAGAKMKAAGKSAGLKLACHAKAARGGATADPACLTKATIRLSDDFTKAESHGGCSTTDDADDITNRIDSSVGAFLAGLRPTLAANRCVGTKLQASGKKAKTKLGCHAKATRKGLAVDPQCLAKAEARFAGTFSSAEAHGPCLTTGDAGAIESGIDDLVNDVVAALPSGGGTTTTTTLGGPACGNGVAEGSEECDGADPGACALFPPEAMVSCNPPSSPTPCRCCSQTECAFTIFQPGLTCCGDQACQNIKGFGMVQPGVCIPPSCTDDADCRGYRCVGGTCCGDAGQLCGAVDCCADSGATCTTAAWAPIHACCRQAGAACDDLKDCCSGSCTAGQCD